MKIAIVCDWLVTYAGAERVLEELLVSFPEADLFAVVDFLAPEDRHFLQNKPVKTTFIQKLPFAKKQYRSYLGLMPLAIEQLDVSAYDLILSSSHAVAKGIITGPNQLHISYVHSPMRYAWDLQHQYLKESGLDKGIKGYFAKRLLHKMRLWDQRTANGVDYFIANSHYIARRISKAYRREADVIYPPVKTHLFKPAGKKEDFYVTASRMVPYKKIDLIVESFAQLPDKKLIVIGDGPEMGKVKSKATANIHIMGYQPTDVLVDTLQRANAFIFAAEEDFGMIAVEAEACGTPVIAYGKGGALETVKGLDQPNPTGLFFPKQDAASICEAVKAFEAHRDQFTTENCVACAAQFSPAIFRKKIKEYVLNKMAYFSKK
ncbi:MAG TPA: glycosyltransferase family 4 protein [Gammaproteobacteria bacterium]|nr:glycosyltransferase family 4 protein [Gammaproteobacteria bacterium]